MKRNHRPDTAGHSYLPPLLLAAALVAGRLFLPPLAAELYTAAKQQSPSELASAAQTPEKQRENAPPEEEWEREILTLAAEARRSPDGRFRRRHSEGRQHVEAQLTAAPKELLLIVHRLSEVAVLRRFSITPGETELYTLYLEVER